MNRLIITLCFILLVFSCSEDSNDSSTFNINFENSDASSNRIIVSTDEKTYTDKGALKYELTPAVYTAGIERMGFYSSNKHVNMLHGIDDEDIPMGNFLEDVPVIANPNDIKNGEYSHMTMLLTIGQGEIKFDLPSEYENINIMQFNGAEMDGYQKIGTEISVVNWTHFTWPELYDSPAFFILFGSDISEAEMINNPGSTTFEIGEMFDLPDITFTTDGSILRAPMANVYLEGGTEYSITVSFDLRNILQIYEGDTSDLEDDVLLFAPYFWNRISANVQD